MADQEEVIPLVTDLNERIEDPADIIGNNILDTFHDIGSQIKEGLTNKITEKYETGVADQSAPKVSLSVNQEPATESTVQELLNKADVNLKEQTQKAAEECEQDDPAAPETLEDKLRQAKEQLGS